MPVVHHRPHARARAENSRRAQLGNRGGIVRLTGARRCLRRTAATPEGAAVERREGDALDQHFAGSAIGLADVQGRVRLPALPYAQ